MLDRDTINELECFGSRFDGLLVALDAVNDALEDDPGNLVLRNSQIVLTMTMHEHSRQYREFLGKLFKRKSAGGGVTPNVTPPPSGDSSHRISV